MLATTGANPNDAYLQRLYQITSSGEIWKKPSPWPNK
jgi:hypothetical protein